MNYQKVLLNIKPIFCSVEKHLSLEFALDKDIKQQKALEYAVENYTGVDWANVYPIISYDDWTLYMNYSTGELLYLSVDVEFFQKAEVVHMVKSDDTDDQYEDYEDFLDCINIDYSNTGESDDLKYMVAFMTGEELQNNAPSKSENFNEELSLIQDSGNRQTVKAFLDTVVPDYFWSIPASSTGKYHPALSQGEGGLVRHTKAAVRVAEELSRMNDFVYVDMDIVYAAIIIHDTFKLGEEESKSRYTIKHHGEVAADKWHSFAVNSRNIDTDFVYGVSECVLWHMGQWSGNKIIDTYGEVNADFENESQMVRFADYMASRKFISMEF